MSIRLRLTLLYTAVLAVTLLAFGMVAYFRLSSSLRSEVDRSLRDRAARELPVVVGRGPGSGAGAGGPIPRGGKLAALLDVRLGDPDVLVQLDDGQHQPVLRSTNLSAETLPLPPHINGAGFATVSVNRAPLRVLIRPVSGDYARVLPGNPQGPYTLLLARSLSETDSALSRLRVIFLLGSVVSLAVAGGVGWLMARGALRPIDRLTAEAQSIGRQQDFTRRVDHQGPDDEVGRLATTFNEMLDGLNAAHQRLQLALEAQRRFVADASHELRTPLTTIRGNVDLLRLQDDAAGPDRQEALADIASEAERMSRLVNNLLALARADGGLHIPRRTVAVEPVISEVCQKARRLTDRIDLRLGEVAPATVMADRDYLVQLLFILVDNAIKYTPAGGSVTIAATFSGGSLRIAVADTGVGIAPADQARIFDRFYQADTSRHGDSTGLGLSIAAWIAGELGGTIELQSAIGKGSTFTLVLPALAAQSLPSPVSEVAVPATV
ncbi:MAG: sensor histidine kinase [Dehalococcoidia bacterium]